MSATQRIVPGAPPPISLSKSQRKKKKAKAKPSDDDPETPVTAVQLQDQDISEPQEPPAAPKMIATAISTDSIDPALSPIVDLITKRLKAANKKLTRIQSYSSAEAHTLNEDQKRMLTNLPVLEAVQRELNEVKKAVESQEEEIGQEILRQKLEAEKLIEDKVAAAVSEAQEFSLSTFTSVLDVIRLHQLHSAGGASIEHSDASAVETIALTLLSDDASSKQSILQGFTSRSGDINGVQYTHILDVTASALAPVVQPSAPPSDATGAMDEPKAGEPDILSDAPDSSDNIGFMQPSEIEAPMDASGEWVQVPSGEAPESHNVAPTPEQGQDAGLDWTDDHEDLPPIDGLHAQFGTSGTATPVTHEDPPPPVEGLPAQFKTSGTATPVIQEEPVAPVTNGHVHRESQDDDGFTTTGGKHRGRGRGGRGSDRGPPRGSFRGRGRGGRGGGERGEQGYRGNKGGGGDRGFRGSYRGDGAPRGRGRGGGNRPPTDS